jgi:hypothetical protein
MKKAVLYFVYFVALANILFFLYAKDFMCIGVFLLAALLTSFFSKNKVLILAVAIVVGNVVCFGNLCREGFGRKRNKAVDKKTNEMKTTLTDMATKITKLYDKEFPAEQSAA